MEARGNLHAAVALLTVEEPLTGLEIESNEGKNIYTKIHNRRLWLLRKKSLYLIKLALGTYGLKPASESPLLLHTSHFKAEGI